MERFELRVSARGFAGVSLNDKAILGYVVAERGPWKTFDYQFDQRSLEAIVRLMNAEPKGVKVNLGHSDSNRPGWFLGRATNARIDGDKVRADLHFSESAFNSYAGNLPAYVMALAKEDPDALSSSLVIDGKREPVKNGLPVIIPTLVASSDIVNDGRAVGALLSNDHQVSISLANCKTEQECRARFEEYLADRFPPVPTPKRDAAVAALNALRGNSKIRS